MNEHSCLLSVIIPCFNYEAYVGEAIDSVLAQQADDVEVFVVDDGSTDASWDRITAYGDRITAIRSQNQGSVTACLTAFQRTSGQFVYILDADDKLAPGALALIRPHLRPEVSKVQFMLQPIDHQGQPVRAPTPALDPTRTSQQMIDDIVRRGSYLAPPTSGNVCRRDIYESTGVPDYERTAVDGVQHLLAPFIGEVVSIDRVLGFYRIHSANESGFAKVSVERLDRVINRFSNRLAHLRQLLDSRGVAAGISFRSDYAYTGELVMIRAIVAGRSPTRQELRSYLAALEREQAGLGRRLRQLFAMLMYALPLPLARRLVRFRLNPLSLGRLQTVIKSLSTGGGRRGTTMNEGKS